MGRAGAFIGDVARQTGLSIHTIRFYEAEQLLPEAPRTEAGYRVYSPRHVQDLKFIKRAQEWGFSLREMRELLVLKDRGTEACPHVKSRLEEKLEKVRTKLRELEGMEIELKRALAQCRKEMTRRQHGAEEQCPVLAKLGHDAKGREFPSKRPGVKAHASRERRQGENEGFEE